MAIHCTYCAFMTAMTLYINCLCFVIQFPLYSVLHRFWQCSDLDLHCNHAGLLFWEAAACCQISFQRRWMNRHFPFHTFLPISSGPLFLEGCHVSVGSCAAAHVSVVHFCGHWLSSLMSVQQIQADLIYSPSPKYTMNHRRLLTHEQSPAVDQKP